LERGKRPTAAKVWHTPQESGGGELLHTNSKYKRTAIATGRYGCILEKTKGAYSQENSK
jgi:hypothetical protein